MHVSRRSAVAVSLLGVLALVGALALVIAPSGRSAQAAATTASVTINGSPASITRLTSASKFLAKNIASGVRSAKGGPYSIKDHSPGGNANAAAARARAAARLSGVPNTSGMAAPRTAEGQLRSNFNAMSDGDQANANGGPGFELTPPDQGLCVGYLTSQFGSQKIVIEVINSAAQVYSTSGAALTPAFSMASAFLDPNAFSDPRCFYDSATQTFFLTVISSNTLGDTVDDVSVLNNSGQTTYQFDTAEGALGCFGDQPKTGFDNNAVYVATDQFCGPGQNTYEGEFLVAISKPQLVNQDLSVHAVGFGPLVLGGIPVLGMEPAFGDGTNTEYLLNSFPYDQFGNNNNIANTLGLWQVTGDRNLTSGSGKTTLTGRIISSETYAFPVPAASSGDGSVTCVPFFVSVDCTAGILAESEAFIDGGDSRMLQVQFLNTDNGPRLYSEITTALTIGSDPSARDGIAWFEVNPTAHRVAHQGYIGVAGTYLVYPALIHTENGTSVISFSMTSPTLNPSSGYVVKKDDSSSFGSVHTTGAGAGPHMSFSGPLPGYNRIRWGDYSASTLDPNGVDIWGAAEYIPPAADQDPVDNWGTRIWDVAGAH